MHSAHTTGWLGWTIFALYVAYWFWARCTDDGIESTKNNRFLIGMAYAGFMAFILLRLLWSATKGFTVNPIQ